MTMLCPLRSSSSFCNIIFGVASVRGFACKGTSFFFWFDHTGLVPAQRPLEEDLPQQYGHGVPGPPVLAAHLPQLHCGKGTGQLAPKEWNGFDQVRYLDLFLFSSS